MNCDDIIAKLNNLHYESGSTYKDKHLKNAFLKLDKNELEAAYHLVESHSPVFRYRASILYEKSGVHAMDRTVPLIKENFNFTCANRDLSSEISDMLNKIEEMPKEWTLIQLTPALDYKQCLELDKNKKYTNQLYITVFDCGQQQSNPIIVTVDAPRDPMGQVIEVLQEIKDISDDHHLAFTKFTIYNNKRGKEGYMEYRMNLNNRMKNVVKVVQDKWLKEWRILLLGKFRNKVIEDKLEEDVNIILKELNMCNLSDKSKTLIKSIARGEHYLDLLELKRAIKYCVPDMEKKDQTNLAVSLRKVFAKKETIYQNHRRHPVILIVEESIDQVPWEMVNVLIDQPVSRMQSLHFTYALFKEHQGEIVDGWKMKLNHKRGNIILNPGLDLNNMENRLSGFFEYWKPEWKSIVGKTPTCDEFQEMLTNCDIFSYNGHGDGFQYLQVQKLQKLRVDAVVLLFGCSSVKLEAQGPQCEAIGTNQNYITACSPCVVGMLWTVTDTDTDLLSTDFISRWVPSKAPVHWKQLDKTKWKTGEKVDVSKLLIQNARQEQYEPELLTALLKAKRCTLQYITQAACVARGLPVKMG